MINAKELGTNCWSADRIFKRCFKCQRYKTCKYPERIADKRHDDLMSQAKELRLKADQMVVQAQQLEGAST